MRDTSTPGAASSASAVVDGWNRTRLARSMRTVVALARAGVSERSASTRTGGSTVTVSAIPSLRDSPADALSARVESTRALSASATPCARTADDALELAIETASTGAITAASAARSGITLMRIDSPGSRCHPECCGFAGA